MDFKKQTSDFKNFLINLINAEQESGILAFCSISPIAFHESTAEMKTFIFEFSFFFRKVN